MAGFPSPPKLLDYFSSSSSYFSMSVVLLLFHWRSGLEDGSRLWLRHSAWKSKCLKIHLNSSRPPLSTKLREGDGWRNDTTWSWYIQLCNQSSIVERRYHSEFPLVKDSQPHQYSKPIYQDPNYITLFRERFPSSHKQIKRLELERKNRSRLIRRMVHHLDDTEANTMNNWPACSTIQLKENEQQYKFRPLDYRLGLHITTTPPHNAPHCLPSPPLS